MRVNRSSNPVAMAALVDGNSGPAGRFRPFTTSICTLQVSTAAFTEVKRFGIPPVLLPVLGGLATGWLAVLYPEILYQVSTRDCCPVCDSWLLPLNSHSQRHGTGARCSCSGSASRSGTCAP